ncbi:MAG: hypothetical protein J0I41_00005 [Filimonas sp.]|nr:hypothetical protein [Filimonas sp.]
MNRRLLIMIAALLCCATLHAQDEFKVIPPPPTVAEIGHYGQASAKLSDGSFGTQIPLYEYKTKHLSFPISLVYNTNGLKVDKVASRVGMDWMLMAGGSIGKMVLGKDDDNSIPLELPANYPLINDSDSLRQLFRLLLNNDRDGQPDIYSFNFNGNNGRFLILKDTIVKLEQNTLDISRTGNGFKIIDNSGIQYYFSTKETSEASSSCQQGGGPTVVNSWLLDQIIHPLGDIITIKYKACDFTYSTGVTQKYVKSLKDQYGSTCTTCGVYPGEWNTNCVGRTRVRGYMIDKVYSNYRGVVQFNYQERTDIPGDSAVRSIQVFDATSDKFGNLTYYNTQPIRTVGFTYSTIAAVTNKYFGASGLSIDNRLFLTQVSIGKTLLSDDAQFYSFQYNNLDDLPRRLSYSQDHFGFFNGKANASLIPQPIVQEAINDFSGYGFGDRKPSGAFSVHGTLSKIIYPTKGYDTIVYEPNGMVNTAGYDCANPDTSISVFLQGTSTFKHVDNFVSAPFTVHCSQLVSINLNLVATETGYPAGNYLVYIAIAGPNGTMLNDMIGRPLQAGLNSAGSYNVFLNAGTYTITMTVQGPSRGVMTFTFNDSKTQAGEAQVPGVRVQKVLTYASQNDAPIVKRYKYIDPATNKSSGSPYLPDPVYQSNTTVIKQCQNVGPYIIFYYCNYPTYTSDNFYSLYTYGGNNIYYNYVTELMGENGENGKIDHEFQVAKDVNGLPVVGQAFSGTPLANYGIYNGFEVNAQYYKNTGGQFVKVKQIRTVLKDDPRLSQDRTFYTFKLDQGFNLLAFVVDYASIFQVVGIYSMKYNMISRWIYVDSTITTEYYDDGNTNTSYVSSGYDNILHQQITRQVTTNSKNEVLVAKMFYPLDTISFQNSFAATAKSRLASQHMYSAVLKRQNFNNGQLLTEQESDYKNDFPVTTPLLNKKYSSILGEYSLDAEVSAYDTSGNILELALKGNKPSSFVWDYNLMYPIAEIKNASVNSVAYTSFEADGKGNWSYSGSVTDAPTSISGTKCYDLSGGSITKNSLPSNTYTVSFWMKSGSATINGAGAMAVLSRNGWTLYRKDVNATSVEIAGTGLIDEVRLYPKDAQMATFVFQPLIGMISQCDATDRFSYYEYDDELRLKLIKDQDGNILKTYQYNYKQ